MLHDLNPRRENNAIEMLLVSAAVAYLLYVFYFVAAPYIWATNPVLPEKYFTKWARMYVEEHDGNEVYALYVLTLLNIAACAGAVALLKLLSLRAKRIVICIGVILSSVFAFSAGFTPPMSTLVTKSSAVLPWQVVSAGVGVAVVMVLLHYLQRIYRYAVTLAAAILLLPICFIATQPMDWTDASYIFSPALRILKGQSLSEIYFQYDLLLSLLAAAWMKLNIDVEYFQVLAQISLYAFILGVFLFSRKLFVDKSLPIFLLIAMTILKMFAMDQEPSSVLQVTPLRLDLWLPLLLLVYFKGARHWACAGYCAVLLVIHKNFGLIYSAAYLQLLLTLLTIDFSSTTCNGKSRLKELPAFLRAHYSRYLYPVLLLPAGWALNRLLFGGINNHNAGLYRKIGIGFLKIHPESFYWYPWVLIGVAFAMLMAYRRRIDDRYLTTGLMLVFLSIGNSIYFFGRSHENNILNISGVLLLLFFFTLDMFRTYDAGIAGKWRRVGAKVVAIAALSVISIYYGNKIYAVTEQQIGNARQGQLHYPPPFRKEYFVRNLETVRRVTRNSEKVYFLTFNDFKYCYFGGYAPVGYFSPFHSWLLQEDLRLFLSGLVAKGYYLVVEEARFTDEILLLLGCNKSVSTNELYFLWKE